MAGLKDGGSRGATSSSTRSVAGTAYDDRTPKAKRMKNPATKSATRKNWFPKRVSGR